MAKPSPVISVRGLEAWYGESHVLHGMSFDLYPGEVITLLGRNGAGKTTTLRSIIGILPKRSGSIRVDGVETIGLFVAACGAARRRLLPGGARHLFEPVRRRKPDAAAED